MGRKSKYLRAQEHSVAWTTIYQNYLKFYELLIVIMCFNLQIYTILEFFLQTSINTIRLNS